MSYIYLQSEPDLWTVGYHDPDGKFRPESDHDTPGSAASRAAFLNGAGPDDPLTLGNLNVILTAGLQATARHVIGGQIQAHERGGWASRTQPADPLIMEVLHAMREAVRTLTGSHD